ncbi:MAG: flagellar hook-associated protein FlgK [Negativicutes bacterium]|nr:flagellar hook-associated protein FlgK [Negativicutes bacterium]
MSSTFSGYRIAASGMNTTQAGLTAMSHNLANMNTVGYSRQQSVSEELVTLQSGGTSLGSGASVAEISRARDVLLDKTYRQQNAALSYWDAKNTNITSMQQILDDMSSSTDATDDSGETGIQAMVTDFFNSWEELAKDPTSQSARQTVTEDATTLVSSLSQVDQQLEQMQEDCTASVKDGVDQLNDYAQQVKKLNIQIRAAEAGGTEANDLRDQRDEIVDEMSSLADVSANEQNGVYTVSIGGVSLVSGDSTHTLVATGTGTVTNPLQVTWKELGSAVNLSGGSIKGQLEDADQSGVQAIDTTTSYDYDPTAITSSIAALRQGLNDLITTVAAQVNTLHSSGTDLDGDTGTAFFTTIDSNQPLSISNIEVNPELVNDPDKVAAAASSDSGDNTIASDIYDLQTAKDFTSQGLAVTVSGFYPAVVSWLSTTGENADSTYTTQEDLVSQVNTQRQSISSVSMDEEMSNMVALQNAYGANSKVLSTLDNMLAFLIDHVNS